MNKIERVRAALEGKEIDYIPSCYWYHIPLTGDVLVDAYEEYLQYTDVDLVKLMNDHVYDIGVKIEKASDWRKIQSLPMSAPCFQKQLEDLTKVVNRIGQKCMLIATVYNPISVMNNHKVSIKQIRRHMEEDPEAVAYGLSVIGQAQAEFAAECTKTGINGIFFAFVGGGEDDFTEEQFVRYIKPYDLQMANAVKAQGELNVNHLCGSKVRFHHYLEYPGHCFNWAIRKNGLSLKEGQELFRRPVMGGLDNFGAIVHGSKEQIRESVEGVISGFGRKGLIMSADCSIPDNHIMNYKDALPDHLKNENIRIAVEASRKFLN